MALLQETRSSKNTRPSNWHEKPDSVSFQRTVGSHSRQPHGHIRSTECLLWMAFGLFRKVRISGEAGNSPCDRNHGHSVVLLPAFKRRARPADLSTFRYNSSEERLQIPVSWKPLSSEVTWESPWSTTIPLTEPAISSRPVLRRTHTVLPLQRYRADPTKHAAVVPRPCSFGIGTWRHLQFRAGGRAGVDRYSAPAIVDGIASLNTTFVNPEIKAIINTQDSGSATQPWLSP